MSRVYRTTNPLFKKDGIERMVSFSYMRIFLLSSLLFIGSFFIAPYADAAGIVPCDGPDCQTCHFIQLGNNILTWIVGVMATICAIVIAVAGLKMVTAGGDTGAISNAKSMITNVIIGFVILLAAWLIVDTVMKVLVGGTLPGFGPWNKIQCVTQPVVTPLPTPTTTPPITTACSVQPLTPITDTLALQMENGQTVLWNNPTLQACVAKFTGIVGGTVTSAYRPPEYQNHLKEVHTKWCATGLQTTTDPNCNIVKSMVQSDFLKHGLNCTWPVATVSNHSSGLAVDITGIAHGSPSVTSAANASCLTWFGTGDPVHYTLKSGCTCN